MDSLLEHKVGRVCLCSTQNQCPVTTSVCMCVELTMAVSTKLNLTRLLVNLHTMPKSMKKKKSPVNWPQPQNPTAKKEARKNT